jgi:YidC/Oxa1 family membrane protein insertase
MNIFDILLIAPIVNALMFFYKIFASLGIPGALGFAIIAVTSAARIAINPFMKKQIVQSQKMQELQPQLAKLQKKYKTEPAKLQSAQLELYRNAKINPGSGCLVFLIQLPLFIGLYNALARVVNNGGDFATLKNINDMLYSSWLKVEGINISFLNFNLSKTPADWKTWGWWYLLVPVVTALLQLCQAYLSGKTMQPLKPAKKTFETDKDGKKIEKKDDSQEMQQMMQKQMLYLFPVMIGWMSYNFPIGLALYWNIFNLFGIWQYRQQLAAKKISPK